MGQPAFAASPATAPHATKSEPIEMSISAVTMTTVMPQAATRVGRQSMAMFLRFEAE